MSSPLAKASLNHRVALQTGRHAGRQVARLMKDEQTQPFRYRDKGSMAMIGATQLSSRPAPFA